jgi:hypothetical protein
MTNLPEQPFYFFCLFGKLQLDCPDEIINNTGFPLEFIPYLIRGGNDMFFQSVTFLSVIPAKPVLDLIGEQGSRN